MVKGHFSFPFIESKFVDNLVFNWTLHCSFEDVKVVILGQDPYHDDGQAHGLSFSVPRGIKIPSSLRNIYKELALDIHGFKNPGHGCLEGWCRQGVLLLNTCLTVSAHKAGSHSTYGWNKFTDAVIKAICVANTTTKIVFLLWGNDAFKKKPIIDSTNNNHFVLTAAHPSPLSAHRGFFGCRHFSKTNEFLKIQQFNSDLN